MLIDPPPSEPLEGLAHVAQRQAAAADHTAGYLRLAWGPPELEFAERLLGRDWDLRAAIGEIWRGLGEAGGRAEGADLRALLAGGSRYPRTPEIAARCVRVLDELGLCEWLPNGGVAVLRVLSSERTDLGRSRAFAACIARHQEAIRFLRSRAQQA